LAGHRRLLEAHELVAGRVVAALSGGAVLHDRVARAEADRQRAVVVDHAVGRRGLRAGVLGGAELDADAALALLVGQHAQRADVAVVDPGVLAVDDVAGVADRALTADVDTDVDPPRLAFHRRHRRALLAVGTVLAARVALAADTAVE